MSQSSVDLFVFYGLIFTAIWGGQQLPWRPPLFVAALLLMAFVGWSARRHGDSLEKRGWDHRWLRPCARTTLLWIGPLILGLFLWALQKPLPPWPKLIFGLLGYPLWALAQEYALLSFSANRLSDSLGRQGWGTCFLNGVLFALVHFPNPMLMTACLISGTLFTRVFYKTPHLLPLALAHALGGFFLSWIFLSQTNAMMVGPAYWKYAGMVGPLP